MKPSFRRKEKYRKNIEGSISQLRLLRYGKEQRTKFKSSMQDQVKIEQVVKSLISGSAPSMLVHFYCDFAKKAVQLIHRHKGANLINELNILDQIWSTRGLNTSLLTAIKNFFYPGYIPPVPCGACAWLYKMKLTFSGNVSATNLDNFPVLVHLTNANFNFAHAKANGEDIRFMDSDLCPSAGTPLKHEIEKWDQAGQEAWVWVKVPRIDGGSVVDFIYMYYGNNAAADGQDPTNVWDSNFLTVQHFNDTTGNDSTGNNKDFAPFGTPTLTTGKIGNGVNLDGDDYYKDLDFNLPSDSLFTFEAWVNPNMDWKSGTPEQGIIDGSAGRATMRYVPGNLEIYLYASSGNQCSGDYPCTLNQGTWYYVAATYDGTTGRLYLDATQVVSCNANWVQWEQTAYMGARIGDACKMNGIFDEGRISNINRTADWITAQHRSMSGLLITYGAEELS